MENVNCRDGYYVSAYEKEPRLPLEYKVAIGSVIFGLAVMIGLSWYGVSMGYFPAL